VRIGLYRGTYDRSCASAYPNSATATLHGQGILGLASSLTSIEPRNALVLDVSRSPQQLAAEVIASLHQSPL